MTLSAAPRSRPTCLRSDLVPLALLAAVACTDAPTSMPVTARDATYIAAPIARASTSEAWPALQLLDFATYDGSHEVVHPDVAIFPNAWNGHRMWVGITPYPNSNRYMENPSLFASDDGLAWTVPAGVTNPLVKTARGHLSDPDIVYNAQRKQLWMYYREAIFKDARHIEDNVTLISSRDGVHWGGRRVLFVDRGHYVVSPAVVQGPDRWRVWEIDAGTPGCSSSHNRVMLRRSADGVRWTAPSPIAFDQPGYEPWHLDVQWVPSRREFWALVAAYPRAYGCALTDLFLATSATGDKWTTYPSPIFARGAIEEFSSNVYRSSFAVDATGDSLTMWLTGARALAYEDGDPARLRWSAAVTRVSVASLLERVKQPAPSPRIVANAAMMREIARKNVLP